MENEGIRQAIQQAAHELGASLTCLKKARQFSIWMDRMPRPLYILVTNWREAQPCAQAIAMHLGTSRPVQTLVLCDSHRQFTRCAEWARCLPPEAGHFQVFLRSDIPEDLLGGLMRQCFGPMRTWVNKAVVPANKVPLPTGLLDLRLPRQIQAGDADQFASSDSEDGSDVISRHQAQDSHDAHQAGEDSSSDEVGVVQVLPAPALRVPAGQSRCPPAQELPNAARQSLEAMLVVVRPQVALAPKATAFMSPKAPIRIPSTKLYDARRQQRTEDCMGDFSNFDDPGWGDYVVQAIFQL